MCLSNGLLAVQKAVKKVAENYPKMPPGVLKTCEKCLQSRCNVLKTASEFGDFGAGMV